jgi:O-antigen ligase/polysaccharide polymerase Wzy-like membrane protein
VSEAVTAGPPARPLWPLAVVIPALIVLTLVALFATGGDPVVTCLPALAAAFLWAVWKLPLRYLALVVVFLTLALENPLEIPAAGVYRSPTWLLGALFLMNLNVTLRVRALAFSGLDLTLALIAVILFVRRLRGIRLDRERQVPTAPPLGPLALVAIAAVLAAWLRGMLSGGAFDLSLWQVQKLLYVPFMFLVFQGVFRGARDLPALGWAVVAAALVKTGRAFVVRRLFDPQGDKLAYLTAHSDSVLFAVAALIAVAALWEQADRRRAIGALVLLPPLFWVMVANHRRIVWASLLFSLAACYFVSAWTPFKRGLSRALVVLSPVLVLYFAVGWQSGGGGIFAPVKTLRSMVESDTDASTLWRDGENYNLLFTWRQNPVFGSGFGHPYIEAQKLPDISSIYPLYRLNPHNSMLGLLAFMGIVWFTLWWMPFAATIFFAAGAYHRLHHPRERAAALVCISTVIVCMNQAYGDVGLSSWTTTLLLALAMAIAGKLAVASGAWPLRRAAVPVPA